MGDGTFRTTHGIGGLNELGSHVKEMDVILAGGRAGRGKDGSRNWLRGRRSASQMQCRCEMGGRIGMLS